MELVKGGPGWEFLKVMVDGDDLLVRGAVATYFGDIKDVRSGQDNGQGAGGFDVVGHPGFIGCSLPQRRILGQFRGCPIPKLPICGPNPLKRPGAQVQVYALQTKKVLVATNCDLGPSKRTGHGIDLTVGAALLLGLDLDKGRWPVDFRIIDGALHL